MQGHDDGAIYVPLFPLPQALPLWTLTLPAGASEASSLPDLC